MNTEHTDHLTLLTDVLTSRYPPGFEEPETYRITQNIDTTRILETQLYVASSRTELLPIIYRPTTTIYNTNPHNNIITHTEKSRLPKTRPWLLPAPAEPAEAARMEGSEPAAAFPGPRLVVVRAAS